MVTADPARTWPFYISGFMGPFGTVVILPMFPELRAAFDATNEDVAWGITAYTLPMAAFLLFSGTIGEHYGRARVLRLSFVFFGLASVATAAAPTLGMFILGRALQGSANAFFTPLMLAVLTDVTDGANVGRRVGIYSSFQAIGGAFAPLAGGLAADIHWRLAFVASAGLSMGLAALIPTTTQPTSAASSDSFGAMLSTVVRNKLVLLIGLASLFAAAGPYAGNMLVGLLARDELGMSATGAGLLILFGSSTAFFLAPLWGALMDRLGPRQMSVGLTLCTCSSLALTGLATSTPAAAAGWLATGSFVVGMVVALQNLAATAVPENRGGALSATMSFRFVGHAIAPLVWVPVFGHAHRAAFAGAASLGLVTALALLVVTRAPRATPLTTGDIPDLGLGKPS